MFSYIKLELMPYAFIFVDLDRSFDLTRLLANVHYRTKGLKPKAPAPTNGKKRTKEVAPRMALSMASLALHKG